MTQTIALAVVLASVGSGAWEAKAELSTGDLDPVRFVHNFEGRLAGYGQPVKMEPTSCSKLSCRYEVGKDQFELAVGFNRALVARWPDGSTEINATRLYVAIETLLDDPDAARSIMSKLSDRLIETPGRATLDASGHKFKIALKAGLLTAMIEPQKQRKAYRPAALGMK